MKSAKEMFEELGYEKIETIDEEDCILYKKDDVSIYIFPNKKEIRKSYNGMLLLSNITLDELQVINKQCEELRWFDE